MSLRRFTGEEDNFIINNYHKIGLTASAKHLNRCLGSIQARRKLLKLNDLSKEERHLIFCNIPKDRSWRNYKVKEDQFINVKTPEVAYILGLLWADGYVKKGEKLSVKGVTEDMRNHINAFQKTGQWTTLNEHKSRYGVLGKPSTCLYTSNINLVEYLESKDYRVKSIVSACKILETIPDHLKHYWFRGLIDGDGSISFKEYNNKKRTAVAVYSSHKQDWKFLSNLCDNLKIKYGIYRRQITRKDGKINSSSTFTIGNRSGISIFCNYIYQNINIDRIGLPRKYLEWKRMEKYFNIL